MEMKSDIIKGYKAYKEDLICEPVAGKPFHYIIGETYHCEEEIIPCRSGFHFCQHPFSVFHYYPLIDRCGNLSVFSEVSAAGDIATIDEDKFCCSDITIGKELSFFDLCEEEVEYLRESKSSLMDKVIIIIDSNDSLINKTFNKDYLMLSILKPRCSIEIRGDANKIATKDAVDVYSRGNNTQILVGGAYCTVDTRGFDSRICSLKDHNYLYLRGENSVVKSLGERSHIYNTNDQNLIRSFGNESYIHSTGAFALIDSQGRDDYIRCLGENCQIRAKSGTLIEWTDQTISGELAVKKFVVDGKNMKEDKFYKLTHGELIETAIMI